VKRGGRIKSKRPTADARRAEESARLKVWARCSQPHGVARCEKCGEQPPTDFHHRKNRSQGGGWSAENGMALDRDCHRWITENPELAARMGWTVRSHEDEALVPCSRFGEYVILLADGGFEPVEGAA
jgi:hypothetical protein